MMKMIRRCVLDSFIAFIQLQIALRDGLLKSDKLNYVVDARRPIINRVVCVYIQLLCALQEDMRKKLEEFRKKLPWIETIDMNSDVNLTDEIVKNDFEREMAL